MALRRVNGGDDKLRGVGASREGSSRRDPLDSGELEGL